MKNAFPQALLAGLFALCGHLSAHAQHVLGYLGRANLLLETGLYRVDNLNDSMVHLLSGRLRVSSMPKGNQRPLDACLRSGRSPFSGAIATGLYYRILGQGHWQPFPAVPGTTLLDTLPQPGDTIVLQLGRPARVEEQLWFVLPNKGPSIGSYRLRKATDTGSHDLVAVPLLGGKPWPPAAEPLAGRQLAVPPGMQPQFFAGMLANKDSFLEYRLLPLHYPKQGSWQRATGTLLPNGLEAGRQYQLQLRFAGGLQQSTYQLVMLPFWYRTPWAALLFSLLAVGIGYWKKMEWVGYSNAEKRLKLATLQWQPHFLANALSAIRESLERQGVQQASALLGNMAHFFRFNVEAANTGLFSLEEELEQAACYLRMQQPLYGFRFGISVVPDIVAGQVDFPPLLLQPLLENAVQHGVKQLGSHGQIVVAACWKGDDLVVTVTDNGHAQWAGPDGGGKKLVQQRIGQLNRLYRNYAFRFQAAHSPQGSSASITITNWRKA